MVFARTHTTATSKMSLGSSVREAAGGHFEAKVHACLFLSNGETVVGGGCLVVGHMEKGWALESASQRQWVRKTAVGARISRVVEGEGRLLTTDVGTRRCFRFILIFVIRRGSVTTLRGCDGSSSTTRTGGDSAVVRCASDEVLKPFCFCDSSRSNSTI